ncbi:MAG: ZIP family metal transporter [Candidatus Liptonbacteria bacterium]|nr:ZIP family metal transporter [Candidatus Liptonbacteria bacterium]
MFLEIILATALGGVLSMIGGVALLWREDIAKRLSLTLVSLAVGSLLGAAFFELLPEAIEGTAYGNVAAAILAGIFTLFLFEKLLKWYHCHDHETCDYHSFSGTVLFGDALHNFVDGVAIALSFGVGFSAGVATTIAVFVHEIPQEIGDFGVLLHAGYGRSRVLLYNFLTALTALVGAVAGYFLFPFLGGAIGVILAFIAGSFIYIAVSDLLPELRHSGKGLDLGHLLAILAGVLIVWYAGAALPE